MSLYFVNSQKGWAAGGIGDQNITRITKTYDGGNNWITQYYSSSQGMVMKISFPDTNNGWAVTLGGNVFKTTNSGLNWNLSFSLSVQFTSCAFLTPNTGWVFGTIGTILKTTDAGITWDDSKCNNN
jgi:photosystem II stability/assembly factor-like uncharacterized protein